MKADPRCTDSDRLQNISQIMGTTPRACLSKTSLTGTQRVWTPCLHHVCYMIHRLSVSQKNSWFLQKVWDDRSHATKSQETVVVVILKNGSRGRFALKRLCMRACRAVDDLQTPRGTWFTELHCSHLQLLLGCGSFFPVRFVFSKWKAALLGCGQVTHLAPDKYSLSSPSETLEKVIP